MSNTTNIRAILIVSFLSLFLLSGCVVDKPMALLSIKYTTWDGNLANLVSNLTIDGPTGTAVLVKNNVTYTTILSKSDLSELNTLFTEANFSFDGYYGWKCGGGSKCMASSGRTLIAEFDQIGGKTISISGATGKIPAGKNSAALQKILDKLDAFIDRIQTNGTVWLTYSPIQCDGNPWEKWYAEGNIQFVKEPTEKQLVISYYSQVYSISINGYNQVQGDDGAVCMACSCPRGDTLWAFVSLSDADKMKQLGWKSLPIE